MYERSHTCVVNLQDRLQTSLVVSVEDTHHLLSQTLICEPHHQGYCPYSLQLEVSLYKHNNIIIIIGEISTISVSYSTGIALPGGMGSKVPSPYTNSPMHDSCVAAL